MTSPIISVRLSGLSSVDVLSARARYGENRLPAEAPVSPWAILIRQFASPLVYIILVAAAISLATGEIGDFVIIMAVVVVDVLLGFVQEYQAQRTYTALKGLLRPTATVLRDGVRQEVEVWELVPDDIVFLAVGDKVPADGELLEVTRLAVDEAILTGESEPVTKQPVQSGATDTGGAKTERREDTMADERVSRVFMGSTVVTGRALMRVTETGTRTELGKVATSLSQRGEEPTPLQRRLSQFSAVLTRIVVAATLVILIVGLATGRDFLTMLRTAIVLAIAAVPEGLIIAITVILVAGMRRILQRQGLVKRLLAVETLGSVTVICTDKTGTLTEGRMRVTHVNLANEDRSLQTMALCNNLEGPVDVALWEYAEQHMAGGPQALFDGSPRLAEELFTSETKYMIAAVTSNRLDGDRHYFLKGAPEIVLSMCDVDSEIRARVLSLIDEWAGRGLRLLGLAYRVDGRLEEYSGYTWVGLVGMEDPVRASVPEAVRLARAAGIRVCMLTGDYRRTAESIAAAVGIADDSPVLEGTDIEALSDEQLRERVRSTSVYARIRPQDKLRIIRALEANGDVTAMIGDGVNDAPALMHADIGVVVGTATDVAKETADVILLDNNFATIVAAIEEGRVIFDNIRKVVAYVLSNSFAEMLMIFVAMMLGWPVPLLVAQILWIHLICDGPEDIVLGFEPAEAGVMEQPPRSQAVPVLDRLGAGLIAVISSCFALVGLAIFGWFHLVQSDEAHGRSMVFATFAMGSVIYIVAYRSLRLPLHRMSSVRSNPALVWALLGGMAVAILPFVVASLGRLLGVVALTWVDWAIVFGFAFAMLGVVEVAKAIARRRAAPVYA